MIIVRSRNNITTNTLLEQKLVLSKHVTLTKSKQVHVIKYNNYYEPKGIEQRYFSMQIIIIMKML